MSIQDKISFNRKLEKNGTWTIFDITTGKPAEIGIRQTTGMQIGETEEILKILNEKNQIRHP